MAVCPGTGTDRPDHQVRTVGVQIISLAGNVSLLANEGNRFWVAFYDGFVGRTCVPLFMIVSVFLLVPMKPGQTMVQF